MKSKLLCSLLVISMISSLSISSFADEPITAGNMTVGESQIIAMDNEETEEVITMEGFEGTLGEDAEPIPFTEEELKDIERFYSENAPSAYDVMPADFGTGWTQVTNTNVSPYIRVAMLKIRYKNGKISYGTGASVGSGVVLTAAHCLIDPDTGSEADSIELFFGRNNSSYYVKATSSSWEKNPNYTGYEPKDDFGIIRVSTSVTSKTGGFGLTSAKPSANMTLTGYPWVEGSNVYNGFKCYTDVGNVTTLYTDGTMQHSMYCTNCDSGAPIYYNGYIYGIHSGDRTGVIGGIAKRVDSSVISLVRKNKV